MVSVVKYFTTSKVPVTYSKYVTQITLAYETYGELNSAKNNALLAIYGFSGSSHVAAHSANDTPGWWEWAVGPGKPLDTNKYFIVCANNLGGCFGSTGSPDISSPSIADIVFCQQKLQEELEIDRWHADPLAAWWFLSGWQPIRRRFNRLYVSMQVLHYHLLDKA
ncbi:hypothetical protein [Sporomusa sp. KB1]|uniref:hypothetical protein n=1 Tax=Sporomusa sp. KB1 TaxID=943346 RepID=UPI0011A8E466|nr:hypothetical protein [Sporomusa sp. KB1]